MSSKCLEDTDCSVVRVMCPFVVKGSLKPITNGFWPITNSGTSQSQNSRGELRKIVCGMNASDCHVWINQKNVFKTSFVEVPHTSDIKSNFFCQKSDRLL